MDRIHIVEQIRQLDAAIKHRNNGDNSLPGDNSIGRMVEDRDTEESVRGEDRNKRPGRGALNAWIATWGEEWGALQPR